MHTILAEEGYPVALLDTYLAMIEGSIGSRQYLKIFVLDPAAKSGKRDVINNGGFACAFCASSLLLQTTLIKDIHTFVSHTIADMLASEWYQVNHLVEGAVIVWGPKKCSDGCHHKHIGFYVGDDMAISTDGVTGVPTKHHVTYGVVDGRPVREIEAIFFHEKLCR